MAQLPLIYTILISMHIFLTFMPLAWPGSDLQTLSTCQRLIFTWLSYEGLQKCPSQNRTHPLLFLRPNLYLSPVTPFFLSSMYSVRELTLKCLSNPSHLCLPTSLALCHIIVTSSLKSWDVFITLSLVSLKLGPTSPKWP